MDREDFMLAVMSHAGNRTFTPVQVQKLFFLLDRNVPDPQNGPYFDFEPYDYGPFDKEVYEELDNLDEQEFVEVMKPFGHGVRTYRLTDEGKVLGEKHFEALPKDVQQYIEKTVDFVRSLSFADLVSAIYKEYPDMKVNSVFSS